MSVVEHQPWHLVISGTAWSPAIRNLLMRGGWAVGPAHQNPTTLGREWLVEQLQWSGQRPSGQSRWPLADWMVLYIVRRAADVSHRVLQTLARQLAPTPSQTLIVLLLEKRGRGAWNGAVIRGGAFALLEEVRVTGPGMLRLTRHERVSEIGQHGPASNRPPDARWSRTVGALGRETFDRLQQASVTLIGAGRNGSLTAFQLAGLGVRSLRIIDPDQLAMENLDAMPGLAAEDVGLAKVEALGRRLLQFAPHLQMTLIHRSAADKQLLEFLRRRTDLIVTCVDDDAPRLAVSQIAQQTLTPHLDIGTSVQRGAGEDHGDNKNRLEVSGDVRLLLPGQGCVACVGGLADEEQTLYALEAPPGSLRQRSRPEWSAQRAGSLVTINAITVGAAVQTWLDYLAGRRRQSFWQRIAWSSENGLVCHGATVDALADCRFCTAFAADGDGAP